MQLDIENIPLVITQLCVDNIQLNNPSGNQRMQLSSGCLTDKNLCLLQSGEDKAECCAVLQPLFDHDKKEVTHPPPPPDPKTPPPPLSPATTHLNTCPGTPD